MALAGVSLLVASRLGEGIILVKKAPVNCIVLDREKQLDSDGSDWGPHRLSPIFTSPSSEHRRARELEHA